MASQTPHHPASIPQPPIQLLEGPVQENLKEIYCPVHLPEQSTADRVQFLQDILVWTASVQTNAITESTRIKKAIARCQDPSRQRPTVIARTPFI